MPVDEVENRVADTSREQVIYKDITNIGAIFNFNPKNVNVRQLGTEFSRNFYVDHTVNQNAFPVEQQMQNQRDLFLDFNENNTIHWDFSSGLKFQQENDSVDSPTLTTNSERSEITEASADFTVQQYLFLQHNSMHQSNYDEMQLMLKQLQVLQRQEQQIQQQNLLNPFSSVHKQGNNGQFPPLGNVSQGYMNWQQRNVFPSQQGTTLNKSLFSMGLGSHNLDVSLYGAPIGNTRGNIGQLSQTVGQMQKPLTQLADFNPFLKEQYSFSPLQGSIPQGSLVPNLGFQGKPNGLLSGNLLMGNSQQEEVNWSSVQQNDTKKSQGLIRLDPLEEKILFNMEDSSISDIASGIFGDKYDNVDFPSIQSGSWSALMQSAVAEASSSDTCVQEEFSGLTYQNMELSADNDKQQANWVNDMEPFTVKSDVSSSFTRFQLLSDQNGGTPESIQRSSNVTGRWVDCSPQQVQSGLRFDDSSDQMNSQIGNLATNTNDSSISNGRGMPDSFQPLNSSFDRWEHVPDPVGKASVCSNFVQQNNRGTISSSGGLTERNESQIHMVNPILASQSNNANRISDVTRQFNVWMDLPTRQYPLDQESSKASMNTKPFADYNVLQRVELPQVHEPSVSDKSFINHPSVNNFPVENNTDSDSSKRGVNTEADPYIYRGLYDENSGLKVSMDTGMNLFASEDAKMKFMVESKTNQNVQIPSQNLPSYDYKSVSDGRLNDSVVHPHKEQEHAVRQSMDIIVSKKRKRMTPPWHEEITHMSRQYQTISSAGQEWAQVTNRLFEKGEYEIGKIESIQPLSRSKRRLTHTTQLMQQLFRPSPVFILLSDVSSNYDSLLYFVARATLGDACSFTHSGQRALPSSSNEVTELFELNERRRDGQYPRDAKELTEKSKNLVDEFERLEKTASISEIKFETEDLERFSVINRFARFHNRVSVDNNGNPSLPFIPKPIPQRYIAAVLSPRNVPEEVQCLSL